MKKPYTVINANADDLGLIYDFFDQSVSYQESKGTNNWKNYDRGAIARDVLDGNEYKVIVDGEIGIVFSVCYADKVIWREKEKGDAVYLHRIVVNPKMKGKRLFGAVVDWARSECKKKRLRFVRMDTWSDNQSLIEYYQSFGFTFIENFVTPDSPDLPMHNRRLSIALLEMEVI